MSKTNDLVSTYVIYQQKKAEIKARHRVEQDIELEPYLADLGNAIIDAQKAGKRIEDIEYNIGAKNRTLVYRAKRLAKGIKDVPAPTPEPEGQEPEKTAWRVVEGRLNNDDPIYYVYIDEVAVGGVTLDENGGSLVLPDAWAADTENQANYREIIAHIKTL